MPSAAGNRARRLLPELMAADAAGVLHRADPLRLRQPRGDAALAAELIGGRDLQHRVPVDGGVVVRRGGFVGRRRRGDRQALSGFGRRLGAVDQPVAARPHLVARRRQIGHDESAAIVGDDALDVADGKVARFGDHPDAGLGPFAFPPQGRLSMATRGGLGAQEEERKNRKKRKNDRADKSARGHEHAPLRFEERMVHLSISNSQLPISRFPTPKEDWPLEVGSW